MFGIGMGQEWSLGTRNQRATRKEAGRWMDGQCCWSHWPRPVEKPDINTIGNPKVCRSNTVVSCTPNYTQSLVSSPEPTRTRTHIYGYISVQICLAVPSWQPFLGSRGDPASPTHRVRLCRATPSSSSSSAVSPSTRMANRRAACTALSQGFWTKGMYVM